MFDVVSNMAVASLVPAMIFVLRRKFSESNLVASPCRARQARRAAYAEVDEPLPFGFIFKAAIVPFAYTVVTMIIPACKLEINEKRR